VNLVDLEDGDQLGRLTGLGKKKRVSEEGRAHVAGESEARWNTVQVTKKEENGTWSAVHANHPPRWGRRERRKKKKKGEERGAAVFFRRESELVEKGNQHRILRYGKGGTPVSFGCGKKGKKKQYWEALKNQERVRRCLVCKGKRGGGGKTTIVRLGFKKKCPNRRGSFLQRRKKKKEKRGDGPLCIRRKKGHA